MSLLIRNARVLTMLTDAERSAGTAPPPARRGKAMPELGTLEAADVLITSGRIAAIGPAGSLAPPRAHTATPSSDLDARARVLMPGFVDGHTHACWGGSRIDEWQMRLAGKTYQEIAAAGGGIMSTVRATRTASEGELARSLTGRLNRMLALGSTTIEVKSGYGLTLEHELKMLRAIRRAAESSPATVIPAALLGHAIDPEFGNGGESAWGGESGGAAPTDARARFIAHVITEALPAVSREFPAIAVDAFCESGAWTLEETTRLFEAAKHAGHPLRVHADQFTSLGMAERAIDLGAASVDHLEASTPASLERLGRSETFGVGLPVCGLHVDGRYANLRALVDAGGKACIATNYNPGSAPGPGMPLAIALAVRFGKLTPAEAIVAATLNPARLLGLTDRGHIAPGARADLILLHHTDERALAYELGDNPVHTVIAAGQVVPASPPH